MSFTDALKSEVFRPVAIILVPGVFANTPFLFVFDHYGDLFSSISSNSSKSILAYIFLSASVIATGLILENMGSRIEVLYWKIVSTPKNDREWREYLRCPTIKDCPSESYIRDLVLRMKFENSFAVALIIFTIGLTCLFFLDEISASAFSHSAIIAASVTAYLLYESLDSVKLLANVREIVLSKD